MVVLKQDDIHTIRVDMEQDIQRIIQKCKALIKKDACMQFYDEMNPLYIQKDASDIGLGAGLLQVRIGMSCPTGDRPYNTIL